jgi:3-hydroxyacyl-CoA dehydrogenase/enoyl-CoA hydratase/3-hydroxybutyryl-CoA epimerase
MTEFQHCSFEIDDRQIGHITLDVQNSSVNILRNEVVAELAQLISEIEQMDGLNGLVLSSAKQNGFVYGADIHEFSELKTEADVRQMMGVAHDMLWRIQQLPYPTICCIDGVAVGGGLEVPLGFDHIILTESKKTMLGFPEINLGIMPGFGGTGRAVARIGLIPAMDMIFTGKPVGAARALEVGLASEVVADRDGFDAAITRCLDKPATRHADPDADVLTEALSYAQQTYLAGADRRHMPALFWIYEHIEMAKGCAEALTRGEQNLFPKMMLSEASHHLRRVFAMTDAVKKSARGDSQIRHVHVIGAGTMGGDIAAVSALRGCEVTLTDMNPKAIDAAIDRAASLFDKRSSEPEAAKARLMADPQGKGVARADIIIEAVAERLEIKQAVFADIEKRAHKNAILATNTSSIMIEDIASALDAPERLVGLHFFNPVPVMPLVEVIAGRQSDPSALERAMWFSGQLGKMPVAVKSVKGFLVNRALLPYLFKAVDVLEAGEQADKIDQALLDFGMPMGPIELCDQIGLDVCLDVGHVLGVPDRVAARFEALISAGKKGRKTQAGFYQWDGKKAVRERASYPASELAALAEDILAPLIAHCRSAVDEQIVASKDDADIGCIMGIGFPRFKGGPLGWADYPR